MIPGCNTAGAAVQASAQPAGRGARHPLAHSQGPAAGERCRQQWGLRRCGGGRRQRAAGASGVVRRPAGVRDGGRDRWLRLRAPRQRRARALRRASCSRGPRARRDIVRLPVPDGLSCAVLHPHLMIETGSARGASWRVRAAAATPSGNGATSARWWRACSATTCRSLSRALEDHVAEPDARTWCRRLSR